MSLRKSILLLCAGAALASGDTLRRPAGRFSMGDLVEDRTHGDQIVEVAGGIEGMGPYAVLIPGAGTVPVSSRNLRLVARVDGPVTCGYGVGDIVDFHLMNIRDRGVVLRAVGPFCQVKTSSSQQFTEGIRLKLVRKSAGMEQAARGGPFQNRQAVQVRSGEYWLPAVVESFDPAAGWYIVHFQDAAARMLPARAYASESVLRVAAGRQESASRRTR